MIANYLGLYHLYSTTRYCQDDYVSDTPIHNASNIACYPYRQVSLCYGQMEMVQNFMDNSYDNCMAFFTKGQKRRMQAMLGKSGPRAQLPIDSTACSAAFIPPIVDVRTTAADTTSAKPTLQIYPNPTQHRLYIRVGAYQNQKSNIQISNILGANILLQPQTWQTGINELSIDLNNWKAGTYFIQTQIDGIKLVRKFSIIYN